MKSDGGWHLLLPVCNIEPVQCPQQQSKLAVETTVPQRANIYFHEHPRRILMISRCVVCAQLRHTQLVNPNFLTSRQSLRGLQARS